MITPKEAMALPAAQLTGEQKIALRELLRAIDRWIPEHIDPRGVTYRTTIMDPLVLLPAIRELRRAGWVVGLQSDTRPSALNPREPQLVGHIFALEPTDADFPSPFAGESWAAPPGANGTTAKPFATGPTPQGD